MSIVQILHFNDVYRVTPQKVPNGTIDVTQFAALLDSIRVKHDDNDQETLVLFSGDLFSPSVESTVTRGSHMVPVINELFPDVALTGNHDFDFGYPHLSALIQDCQFPWILSNIVDRGTGNVPEHLKLFEVFERDGVKIGVIGLVERDWIETVSAWPSNFQWRSMEEVGIELSQTLRDPSGSHNCDIVIALTHSRIPNDISLAKSLGARVNPDPTSHGVDLILGGHDHLYYVGKAAGQWEEYEQQDVLGAEGDDGVLVIKSGSDFRDLSEITLEIADSPAGSVRRKVVRAVTGKRHTINPGSPFSEQMRHTISDLLSSVSESLKAPVCRTLTPLDVRSGIIRTEESASGNWFADVLRHVYDEALCLKGVGGADGVLICGGTLRGDSVYGPGLITLGDIMEILPFTDHIVVVEIDGETLWTALESGLAPWPAQEGRFPIVSGFIIEWESKRPEGQRVLGVWLTQETDHGQVKGEEIKRERGERKFKIVTRDYLAQGHDGYEALKGSNYLIDEENGMTMSSIVRRYLLGSQYIHMMNSLSDPPTPTSHLSSRTGPAIERAKNRQSSTTSIGSARWKDLAYRALKHSREHISDALNVGCSEHMSDVDCYDGKGVRGGEVGHKQISEDDLIVIKPVVDGRLKDSSRS